MIKGQENHEKSFTQDQLQMGQSKSFICSKLKEFKATLKEIAWVWMTELFKKVTDLAVGKLIRKIQSPKKT